MSSLFTDKCVIVHCGIKPCTELNCSSLKGISESRGFTNEQSRAAQCILPSFCLLEKIITSCDYCIQFYTYIFQIWTYDMMPIQRIMLDMLGLEDFVNFVV